MAIMIRAGSRALRMTATAPGLARLKYGSTNSSRRPFGASTIGISRFAARSVTQALKLVSDVAQGEPCHRKDLSIGTEEANDPLWLLERLDQPIEQNAVKTTIVPTDAVFVVLEEGVHDRPQLPRCSRDRSGYLCPSKSFQPSPPSDLGISRAEPLASWLDTLSADAGRLLVPLTNSDGLGG